MTSGRYTFAECVALSEHGVPGRVMSALDELFRAEFVALSDKDYSLSDVGFRDSTVRYSSSATLSAGRFANRSVTLPAAGFSRSSTA